MFIPILISLSVLVGAAGIKNAFFVEDIEEVNAEEIENED